MMNNVNIPLSDRFVPHLHAVKKPARLRDHIDKKREYLFIKRGLDILGSLFVILFILSWMVPLVFLLTRIDSPGPVFFLQRRTGRGGRSFLCYKFRTMVVNAEQDHRPATENDERITKLGRILRRSNLDEFPQFINVLLGSMSIVGPRPHMYADCNRFASVLPGYKFRNMVRPGITGCAQVRGYYGTAITRESVALRSQWDNYYVKNLSFWLDCRIIFTTAIQRMKAVLLNPFTQTGPEKEKACEIS